MLMASFKGTVGRAAGCMSPASPLYRKMTELLHPDVRLIGSLCAGKEQRAWRVHDLSPIGKRPRPRQDGAASRAGVCCVVSSWRRNSIQPWHSSLGASQAWPRYLFLERNPPPAGWQDCRSNGVHCCSVARRNFSIGRYGLRR